MTKFDDWARGNVPVYTFVGFPGAMNEVSIVETDCEKSAPYKPKPTGLSKLKVESILRVVSLGVGVALDFSTVILEGSGMVYHSWRLVK